MNNLLFIKNKRDKSTLFVSAENHIYVQNFYDEITFQYAKELFNLFTELNVKTPNVKDLNNPPEFSLVWDDLWVQNSGILLEKFFELQDTHMFEREFMKLTKISLDLINKQFDRRTDFALDKHFMVYDSFRDLKKESILDPFFIMEIREKIEDILKWVPLSINHGDFNPYNILGDTLIDFEDVHVWYIWYDNITFISHPYRNPLSGDYESFRKFNFNKKHIQSYLDYLSKNDANINFLNSKILGALVLLRWCWAIIWLQQVPKKQIYRYNKFKNLAEVFLKNDDLFLDYFLNTYDT